MGMVTPKQGEIMSNKPSAKSLAEYRLNLGRQFATKYKLKFGDGDAATETPVLYYQINSPLRDAVKQMRTETLARIIGAVRDPIYDNVPLLLPLGEYGLLHTNPGRLSGRNYLEILAHAALVGAVYDYLQTLKEAKV